jgi:hypothetical protein
VASFAINKTADAVVSGTVSGIAGQINMATGKGEIDLSLSSLDTGNPLRDKVLLGAFFGAIEPPQNAAKVLEVWAKIEPRLTRGTTGISFRAHSLEGLPKTRAAKPFTVKLRGHLEIWQNGIGVPLMLTLKLSPQADGSYLAQTTEPASANLQRLIGDPLWGLINAAMVAGGCPHPEGGIGNEVRFELKGVRLIAL